MSTIYDGTHEREPDAPKYTPAAPHVPTPIVYDSTVEGELRDLPGVRRLVVHYHLWQADKDGNLARNKYWDEAFRDVEAGRDVVLDPEPDTNKAWPHPVDPSKSSIEEVRKTHAIFAQQLEPLCRRAERTGARVWIYRFLSLTNARGQHTINDPRSWQEDTAAVVNLEYAPGKTIAGLLAATGGGEVCECYVPPGWNKPDGLNIARCVLQVERQQATLERLGVKTLPVLCPVTAGEKEPVHPDVWRAMVFAARGRGRIAVWSGPHQTAKGEPWYPAMDEALKGVLK